MCSQINTTLRKVRVSGVTIRTLGAERFVEALEVFCCVCRCVVMRIQLNRTLTELELSNCGLEIGGAQCIAAMLKANVLRVH